MERSTIVMPAYRSGKIPAHVLRLWTIQPRNVWDDLQRQGTLRIDPQNASFSHDLREEYDWMREQMRLRLPDYGGHYPWWAYEHKPHLRSCRFGPGAWVRIELAVPAERVLLSAYGDWHYVLNKWYLPHATAMDESERESAAWDEELQSQGLDSRARLSLPDPWRSRMIASWDRIFDVDELRATNTIQACFECLDLRNVVKVTLFSWKDRE